MNKDQRDELHQWKSWNIDTGLVLKDKDANNLANTTSVPRHQRKAGLRTGLSILINPQLTEYEEVCRTQDSVGFRVCYYCIICMYTS
jgi:hypothetical protein